MKYLQILLFIILSATTLHAQDLVTVTGRVTDADTRQPVNAASVTDLSGHYATVTNEDGTFILKTGDNESFIRVSHIGYNSQKVKIVKDKELRITLKPASISLNTILAAKPEDVVAIAIKSIGDNYTSKPVTQRCFYRETTRKGNRYIYVAEAITDMYRTPYTDGINFDKVAIIKARRLISTSVKDTLGAKLMGGPTTPLTLDAVKNPDFLLNKENLAYYDFSMNPTLSDDGKGLVKVTITPKKESSYNCPYALLYGDIYITTDSIAITHLDLQLDLTDKVKATRAMLYSKPIGVRFKPKGLTTYLSYKPDNTGRLSLSYIRTEVSFVCEWKRKFFAAPYHVVSEMVVTDELTDSVKPIKTRDSFKRHESLYDHPEYFRDPGFWQQYNIIAPSESLEKGVSRLLKKITK